MNLVIRNPASPELICQSGNLIYFKSGTTIRCLQIRAKEFFNALLSQTRNPLKLGFI
jgi:hypothetical protein